MKRSVSVHDKFFLAEAALEVVLVQMRFLVMQERRDELVGFSANLSIKMTFESSKIFSIAVTYVTNVMMTPEVLPHVDRQLSFGRQPMRADIADEWP